MRTVSVALDLIARRILQELSNGPLSTTELATVCTGGAIRLISPRLVWLEGLGLIEGTGAGSFAITTVGVKFLGILP